MKKRQSVLSSNVCKKNREGWSQNTWENERSSSTKEEVAKLLDIEISQERMHEHDTSMLYHENQINRRNDNKKKYITFHQTQ